MTTEGKSQSLRKNKLHMDLLLPKGLEIPFTERTDCKQGLYPGKHSFLLRSGVIKHA